MIKLDLEKQKPAKIIAKNIRLFSILRVLFFFLSALCTFNVFGHVIVKSVDRLLFEFLMVCCTYLIYRILDTIPSYGEYHLFFRFGLTTHSLGQWFLKRINPIYHFKSIFSPYELIPLEQENPDLYKQLQSGLSERNIKPRAIAKAKMSQTTTESDATTIGIGIPSKVILGDNLIAKFSPDEIKNIFFHELGHQVHFDSLITIALYFIRSLIYVPCSFVFLIILAWKMSWSTELMVKNVATTNFLITCFFGIYWSLTTPIWNSIIRWQERRADAYAIKATDKPLQFISAMIRLSNEDLIEYEPNPFFELIFNTHPSPQKRVAMAENWIRDEGK